MENVAKLIIYSGTVALVAILGLGWMSQQELVRALMARIGSVISKALAGAWAIVKRAARWLQKAFACTIPLLMALIILGGELFDTKNFPLWIAIAVWFVVVFLRWDKRGRNQGNP